MKFLLKLSVLSLISLNAFATPRVIDAPVSKVFVPKGFDNNDNVEVIVRGTFPDSCHARNKYTVSFNGDKIDVKVTANRTEGPACEQVQIPYLENITIGSLQAGQYQITVNGTLKQKLEVTEASSRSVDDHLYGMIQYVELGFTGGVNGQVYLVGKSPDCLELDRLETISNGKDTLSILPIMKKVRDCQGQRQDLMSIPVSFDIRKFVDNEILLFVRTMDGKSVHSLIER